MKKKEKHERVSIKNWPEDDRPREKMIKKGISALSNSELIAILIGNGTKDESAIDVAQNVLNHANNNINELSRFTLKQLCKINGIKNAKALRIIAALELGRRRNAEDIIEKKKITSSNDVFILFKSLINDLSHEEFWVLYLNHANNIIDHTRISQGGIAGTITDLRIIFKTALDKMATNIIVCHNHPSGNLIPSEADIKLTNKLFEAGKIIDIQLLDHLIIANNKYYSFCVIS